MVVYVTVQSSYAPAVGELVVRWIRMVPEPVAVGVPLITRRLCPALVGGGVPLATGTVT